MRDQSKEKGRREALYEKYGHFIHTPSFEIPKKHRAKLGGGLRCFGKVPKRDKKGEKLKRDGKYIKRRCKNPAIKGSLFCRKCGGGNSNALVHGRDTTMSIYKGVYTHEFQDVLDAFINDPKMSDLRPELAQLRAILRKYIEKLVNAKPKSPKRFMKVVESIANDDVLGSTDKYYAIKELVDQQTDITDGAAIDRINRIIDSIGKTIDRIKKIQTSDEYMFTPDGLKILLRAVVETIQKHVTEADLQNRIREELLKVSTMTGGDIVKYEEKIIDVEAESEDNEQNNPEAKE